MKTPLFFVASALLVVGSLVVAPLARAQDAAETAASSPQSAPNLAPQTGYERLVAAGKLILPGPNGRPSSAERLLAPAENLRLQRLAVARNAPALKLLREALRMPIVVPEASNPMSFPISDGGKFRELARQLSQEADVRAADGDFAGALGSRLDCIEMGVAVSRGSITSMLVGTAIESVGRGEIEKFAAKTDAPTARAAANRLAQIEARRPTFAEILKLEGQTTLNLNLWSISDAQKNSQQILASRSKDANRRETLALLALKPETVRANNARLFTAAIQDASLTFSRSRKAPLPRNLDILTEYSLDTLGNPALRFLYERGVTQNQLLQLALELRAAKPETGSYPATLSAPTDHFSPASKPLIYRRSGQSYALYSVGPDGADNGGKPPKRTREIFDAESGAMQTVPARGIQVDSKGDILAPIF